MTGFGREDIELRRHADTVLPGTRTEHARGAMEIRILVALEVALRQGFGRRLEQLRKAGKHVARQSGDAQRHIDARPAKLRQRDELEPSQAAGALVPARLYTAETQRHRQLLTRPSHAR